MESWGVKIQKLYYTPCMFWIIGINFGLRERQEHRDLCMENFRLEKTQNGEQVLTYRETVSKTYRGALAQKQ
jgi:hypothetical protein